MDLQILLLNNVRSGLSNFKRDYLFCSKGLVLNWGQFSFQDDIWQCLETFLVLTTGLELPTFNG